MQMPQARRSMEKLRWGQTWKSFAGVKLGFRFSTELQTAARTIKPKRGRMNRGGTSAPLADELYQLEVRVVFAIGEKRLIDSQRRSWTSPPKLGPAPGWRPSVGHGSP